MENPRMWTWEWSVLTQNSSALPTCWAWISFSKSVWMNTGQDEGLRWWSGWFGRQGEMMGLTSRREFHIPWMEIVHLFYREKSYHLNQYLWTQNDTLLRQDGSHPFQAVSLWWIQIELSVVMSSITKIHICTFNDSMHHLHCGGFLLVDTWKCLKQNYTLFHWYITAH